MVLQDAFEAAQRFLNEVVRPLHRTEIVIVTCASTDTDWIFGYDSRAFVEEGKLSAALVGNGPVVVPRSGQAPYVGPVVTTI
jgi:hypothetical protein